MLNLTKTDVLKLGCLVHKLGEMAENMESGTLPCLQACFNVVTAKGPSYEMQSSDLNGHACGLLQLLDEKGDTHYRVLEATTNLTMQDLPEGCPERVKVHLENGIAELSVREVLATIGHNVSQMAAMNGKTRLEELIAVKYADPAKCPFYMSSFYLNAKMGPFVPSMIPLYKLESSKNPVFGAPVLEVVKGVPINLANALGEEHAKTFLSGLLQRNLECNPPRLNDEDLKRVASHWGALESIEPLQSLAEGVQRVSAIESNLDAVINDAHFELKTRIAANFNKLQASDPDDDGVRIQMKKIFLGTVCQINVPLPKAPGEWNLTCARNLRTTVHDFIAQNNSQTKLSCPYFQGRVSKGHVLRFSPSP